MVTEINFSFSRWTIGESIKHKQIANWACWWCSKSHLVWRSVLFIMCINTDLKGPYVHCGSENGFVVLRGATGGARWHALRSALAGPAGVRWSISLRWWSTWVEGPGTYGRSSVGCIRSGGLKLDISANRFSSRLCAGSSGSRSKHEGWVTQKRYLNRCHSFRAH